MDRQELLDHPEKYVVRAYDLVERTFVYRDAGTIPAQDLETLDLHMVIQKTAE